MMDDAPAALLGQKVTLRGEAHAGMVGMKDRSLIIC